MANNSSNFGGVTPVSKYKGFSKKIRFKKEIQQVLSTLPSNAKMISHRIPMGFVTIDQDLQSLQSILQSTGLNMEYLESLMFQARNFGFLGMIRSRIAFTISYFDPALEIDGKNKLKFISTKSFPIQVNLDKPITESISEFGKLREDVIDQIISLVFQNLSSYTSSDKMVIKDMTMRGSVYQIRADEPKLSREVLDQMYDPTDIPLFTVHGRYLSPLVSAATESLIRSSASALTPRATSQFYNYLNANLRPDTKPDFISNDTYDNIKELMDDIFSQPGANTLDDLMTAPSPDHVKHAGLKPHALFEQMSVDYPRKIMSLSHKRQTDTGQTTTQVLAIFPFEVLEDGGAKFYSTGERSWVKIDKNFIITDCSVEYSRYISDRYSVEYYESNIIDDDLQAEINLQRYAKDSARSYHRFGVVDAECFIPKTIPGRNEFVPFMFAISVPADANRPPTIFSNGSKVNSSFKTIDSTVHIKSEPVARAGGLNTHVEIKNGMSSWDSNAYLPFFQRGLAVRTVQEMESAANKSQIWTSSTRKKATSKAKAGTRRNCVYYAHNGGAFDFNFFRSEEDAIQKATGFYFTRFERRGMVYSLTLTRREIINDTTENVDTIVLKDSIFLLPFSQDTITKSFNVPVKKGTHPFKWVAPDNLYSIVESWSIPDNSWSNGVPNNLGTTVNIFELYRDYNISDCQGLWASL